MIVLGIETTCDETSASLVKDGRDILSNVISSSVDIHEQYGGVVPELACQRHLSDIISVITEALIPLKTASEVDLIAVAKGPGLIGALLIGMQVAKGLSISWNKPLIGVNHVEAHLYAAMMSAVDLENTFPALGIVLSGGHTFLVEIVNIGQYVLLGTTIDDAIGEAFDKVGVLLGLSYPGGPKVEKLAQKGNPHRFPFKRGQVKTNPLHFSFSGLKTSVFYATKNELLNEQTKADIAASFQEIAFFDVISKASLAIKNRAYKGIYIGGGVSNNQYLRSLFSERFTDLPVFWPPPSLSLDNGAMIAGLGYHKFLQNPSADSLDLEVQARIPIA